jgi:peptidoglycan/xylan/chitin deacetylase (PgdA/CDA1 family)
MVVPFGRLCLAVALFSLMFSPRAIALAAATGHNRAFVPVLIFHHVKWLKRSDDAIERGLTVLPSEFNAELAYLSRAHYQTISAARLVQYLRSGGTLPSKPIVLTFDDGYADMWQTAYSMLRRRHMVATFFIVPGFLNSTRYLTWAQVETMARQGMDIEAHTMTHPDLTLVPLAQVRGELSQSRRQLESHLHRPVRVFAYPYGDYNASVVGEVARAGYWAAFTTHQGWWQERSELLTLPRIYVDRDDTVAIFAGRLRADPQVLAQDPT